jgi:hypothetical protein
VIDKEIIKENDGKGWKRCGGVVFDDEKVIEKGREWNSKCLKCSDWKKKLD